jgi:hypothetical protein
MVCWIPTNKPTGSLFRVVYISLQACQAFSCKGINIKPRFLAFLLWRETIITTDAAVIQQQPSHVLPSEKI